LTTSRRAAITSRADSSVRFFIVFFGFWFFFLGFNPILPGFLEFLEFHGAIDDHAPDTIHGAPESNYEPVLKNLALPSVPERALGWVAFVFRVKHPFFLGQCE